MKVFQVLACSLMAITTLPSTTFASSGKGKPGYCDSEKDCTKKAAGYTCVSVQTTRENVEYVKQCLPTSQPVCTGTQPGLCPSFSNTWGTEFRQISSVCAYILPEGKSKCMKPGETGKKGYVECIYVKDNDDETNKQIGVIYGCVDFDGSRLLFKKNEKSDKLASQFNYTGIISAGCVNPKNPSGASFVCSSQGTCGPKAAGELDYECKCNVGFQGKYCEKLVNNKCYNDGVCGGGVCDLTTQECTKCKPGTKGNKCSECDPTYENVCSGKGQCVASDGTSTLGASDTNTSSTSTSSGKNQCKCNDGWTDVACNVKVAGKQPETEGGSPDDTPATTSTGITSTMASLTIIAATVIVSLL